MALWAHYSIVGLASLYSEPQMRSIDVILSMFWIKYQSLNFELNLGGEKNGQHMLVLKSV